MIFAGKLCIRCFLIGCSSIIIYSAIVLLCGGHHVLNSDGYMFICTFLLGHFLTANLLLRVLLKDLNYQIAVRACMLGSVFACGFFTSMFAPETYVLFGWYVCILSFFHCSEFVSIAACNPKTLDIKSFVLNHSLDYKVAAVSSWIEFFVERYFWPEMKTVRIMPSIGLIWCIGGELLRKTAMLTASKSFTHEVVTKKAEHHLLVTKGVYSIFRHPSYVGWFYWAIGTQVVLANPFCAVAYCLATWKFFNDRITIEELTLLNFFGNDYVEYQKKVPIGIPFINGYVLED